MYYTKWKWFWYIAETCTDNYSFVTGKHAISAFKIVKKTVSLKQFVQPVCYSCLLGICEWCIPGRRQLFCHRTRLHLFRVYAIPLLFCVCLIFVHYRFMRFEDWYTTVIVWWIVVSLVRIQNLLIFLSVQFNISKEIRNHFVKYFGCKVDKYQAIEYKM